MGPGGKRKRGPQLPGGLLKEMNGGTICSTHYSVSLDFATGDEILQLGAEEDGPGTSGRGRAAHQQPRGVSMFHVTNRKVRI